MCAYKEIGCLLDGFSVDNLEKFEALLVVLLLNGLRYLGNLVMKIRRYWLPPPRFWNNRGINEWSLRRNWESSMC